MNLRLKLLLIFITASLAAFTFFGFIAYDTAQSANLKNELDLLASVAPSIADAIGDDLEKKQKWNPVLEGADGISTDHRLYLFVADQHGAVISAPDLPELRQVFEQLHTTPDTRTGSLSHNASLYLWARAEVPKTNYQAVLISPSRGSAAYTFFREMGVSLIVTAMIVLWFASWGAMYVANLFEKVDEQKNILRHRALHDELTSLPNRALLNDRLQQIITSAERESASFALCFIDLNRFKEVNDTLGHHCGDELLLEVSRRLQNNLRKSDTVARIGGDEFALVLCRVDLAEAKVIAEKLMQCVELPVEIHGHKLHVTGSLGIALFPDHGADVETLLQKADVAMYAAKRSGTQIETYRHEFEVFSRDKLALTNDLHDAIHNNQLELYYQPKYHLATKTVVGAEALLRWKHPSVGYIPPATFVQIAEHTGLIRSLTKWVLQQAFCDYAHIAKHAQPLNMAINLSAHNLQDPDLEAELAALLEQWKVCAQHITLELTESAVVFNPAQTKQLLTRLTTRGFRISVDDFGTGYSTLTNLRRLPISEIKIDRSFVDNMVRDPGDASIVRATIGLGKALGLDVVAEGVETQEVLDALQAAGCETIQGYFIGKPMPLATFLVWRDTFNNKISEQHSQRA